MLYEKMLFHPRLSLISGHVFTLTFILSHLSRVFPALSTGKVHDLLIDEYRGLRLLWHTSTKGLAIERPHVGDFAFRFILIGKAPSLAKWARRLGTFINQSGVKVLTKLGAGEACRCCRIS